jgi:hypothetical protein
MVDFILFSLVHFIFQDVMDLSVRIEIKTDGSPACCLKPFRTVFVRKLQGTYAGLVGLFRMTL